MATDTTLGTPQQASTTQTTSQQPNAGPDFLRNVATKPKNDPRFIDMSGLDEVDHHIVSYRAQLETLSNQISNLDNIIALEQQKLRDSKAALDASFHARTRLLHLRTAMLHFVMELEARQTE